MKIQIPDWCGLLFFYGIAILVTSLWIKGTGTNPSIEGVVLVWLFAISGSAAAYARRVLEKYHTEVYEDLGSPLLFASPYHKDYWRFMKFIVTFEFLELKDTRVNTGFSISLGLSLLVILIIVSQ